MVKAHGVLSVTIELANVTLRSRRGIIETLSHWMRNSFVDRRISSSEVQAFLFNGTNSLGRVGSKSQCNSNPFAQIKPQLFQQSLAHVTGAQRSFERK